MVFNTTYYSLRNRSVNEGKGKGSGKEQPELRGTEPKIEEGFFGEEGGCLRNCKQFISERALFPREFSL